MFKAYAKSRRTIGRDGCAFSEFFSIGPIHKLHMNEGQLARQEWLVNNLTAYENYFEEEYLPRFLETMEELHTIPIETPITILESR
ncbi:DUF1835 domain-containing protein [Bacillus cereus]